MNSNKAENKSKNKVFVLIPAAGSGSRMGGSVNKLDIILDGVSVLERTLRIFENMDEISKILVCVKKSELKICERKMKLWGISKALKPAKGGDSRQESVFSGLSELFSGAPRDFSENSIVLIHDAARCLADEGLVRRVINGVREKGAAAAAVRLKDTVKLVDDAGKVIETPNREFLRQVQTPQGFYLGKITKAYRKAEADGFSATDDAGIFEYYGEAVYLTEGSYENIKITGPEDIGIALSIIKNREGRAKSCI